MARTSRRSSVSAQLRLCPQEPPALLLRSPWPCWDPPRTPLCPFVTCRPCSSTSRVRCLCGFWWSFLSLSLGWAQLTGTLPRAVSGAGVSAAKHLANSPPHLPLSLSPSAQRVPCSWNPKELGAHHSAPQCPGDPNPQWHSAQPKQGHSLVGPQVPQLIWSRPGLHPIGLGRQKQHGQCRDVSGKGAPQPPTQAPCTPRTPCPLGPSV